MTKIVSAKGLEVNLIVANLRLNLYNLDFSAENASNLFCSRDRIFEKFYMFLIKLPRQVFQFVLWFVN